MRPPATPSRALGPGEKVRLASGILLGYAIVRLGLRRLPLPELVARLSSPRRTAAAIVDPVRLGRIAYRMLRIGPYRARCLTIALVVLRLLRRQGVAAEVVIGLPDRATTKDAHAWLEIDGEEVGPPPGRQGRVELVRYPGLRARNRPRGPDVQRSSTEDREEP